MERNTQQAKMVETSYSFFFKKQKGIKMIAIKY